MEANSGLWPKKIRLTVCLNEALNEELRRASLEQDKLISAISRGVLTQWALARAAACLNAGMAVNTGRPFLPLPLCLEFSPSNLRERFLENDMAQLRIKRGQHSSVGTESARHVVGCIQPVARSNFVG